MKRWTKLLCFIAGNLVFFRKIPVRDMPAAGVKKLEQNFYVSAWAVGFFLKESPVRDVPAAGGQNFYV